MKSQLLKTLFFLALLSVIAPAAQAQCDDAADYNIVAETANNTVQQPVFNKPMSTAVIATPNNSLQRNIFWLHGLGANSDSWQPAAQSISGNPLYNVDSYYPDYYQNQQLFTLADLADAVYNNKLPAISAITGPGNAPATDNIIVGHSLGGIVARQLDMMQHADPADYPAKFGGLVTFGSPHQGAAILDHSAEMQALAVDACSRLSDGPEREFPIWGAGVDLGTYLNNFGIGIGVEDFVTDFICGPLIGTGVQLIEKHNNQNIAPVIKENSTDLNTLNAYGTSTPKVAFYGIEDEPVFFNAAYYLFVKKPQLEPVWDAVHDDIAVTWANGERQQYESKRSAYDFAHKHLFKPWDPPFKMKWVYVNGKHRYLAKFQCKQRAIAFANGRDWWDDANDLYLASIGAITAQPIYSAASECVCTTYDPWDPDGEITTVHSNVTDPQDCANLGDNIYTTCGMSYNTPIIIGYALTKHPSDGVVLSQSAMNMPYATHPPVNLNEMQNPQVGSSHPQMRNDENARIALERLFKDGLYGQFFELD